MGKVISAINDLYNALKMEYASSRVNAKNVLAFHTYRCTSQCKTCNIWKRVGNDTDYEEISVEKYISVLQSLKDYGIKTYEIFGGDALIRKELIYAVISFCSNNGIETYFPTNSLMLDRETAKNLVNAGLDTIYFSLDDIGDANDAIRGKGGTFNRVKDALENITRERTNGKPKIIICSTISNMNYDRFSNTVKFLSDYPIDAIYPRIVQEFHEKNIEDSIIDGIKPDPYFASSDGSSHLFNEEEVKTFRSMIEDLKKDKENKIYVNYINVDIAKEETFTKGIRPIKRCLACTTLAIIDPMGNVLPCPMYNKYILGNLQNEKMENIWGNEKHHHFIKLQRQKKIRICEDCALDEYYPSFYDTFQYKIKSVLKVLS